MGREGARVFQRCAEVLRVDKFSADHLGRQLLRNSGLMLLARAAGVVTTVLCVPVVINRLGKEAYGVWETLAGVSWMIMIFQTVVSGTMLWRISLSYGAGDAAETRRLVRIGIGATLTLIALFVPMVWFLREGIVTALRVPSAWSVQAEWILPGLVAVLLLGGVNESLVAVITGYQRAGVASLIQSAGMAATNLAAILLLLAGGNLTAILAGYLAGFILMFAVLYPMASSLCGRISILPLRPQRRDFGVLGPFAALLLVSNLSIVLRDHTDKVVLASLDSPLTTAYFGMAQRLANLIFLVCSFFYTPFAAAAGTLFARNDWAGIGQLYAQFSLWVGVACGAACLVVCSMHQQLFVLWLGQSQPEAARFLVILMAGGIAAVILSGIGSSLAKGIGRPGLETAYAVFGLVLNLILKVVLIQILGPAGTAWASAVSWGVGAFLFLLLLHRVLPLPRVVVGRALAILALTAVLCVVCRWGMGQLPPPAGRGMAFAVLAGATPLLVVGYVLVLVGFRVIPAGRFRPALSGVAAIIVRRTSTVAE